MKILLAILCALALFHNSCGYVAPQEAEPSPRFLSGLLDLGGDLLNFGFGTFSAITNGVLNGLTSTATNLGTLADKTQERLKGIVNDLFDDTSKTANTTLNLFKGLAQVPIDALNKAGSLLKLADPKKGAAALASELDKAINAANSALNELKSVNATAAAKLNDTLNTLKDLASKAKAALGSAANSATGLFSTKPLEKVAGDQLVNGLKSIFETGASLINNATTQFGDALKSLPFVPFLKEAISAGSPATASNLLNQAKSLIESALQNATKDASQTATDLANKLGGHAQEFVDAATQAVSGLNTKVQQAVQGLDAAKRAALQDAWSKLQQVIQTTQGGVSNLSKDVLGKVLEAVNSTSTSLGGNIKKVLDNILNTKQSAINAVAGLAGLAKDGTGKVANCTAEAALAAHNTITPFASKMMNLLTQPLSADLLNSLTTEAPKLADIATKLAACLQAQSTAVQNQAGTMMTGSSYA